MKLLISIIALLISSPAIALKYSATTELLKVMKFADSAHKTATTMLKAGPMSGMPAAAQKDIEDFLKKIYFSPSLAEKVGGIYEESFSESEIKELIKFYQSPVGVKYLEKLPDITQKSMQIMQSEMMNRREELEKILKKYAPATK